MERGKQQEQGEDKRLRKGRANKYARIVAHNHVRPMKQQVKTIKTSGVTCPTRCSRRGPSVPRLYPCPPHTHTRHRHVIDNVTCASLPPASQRGPGEGLPLDHRVRQPRGCLGVQVRHFPLLPAAGVRRRAAPRLGPAHGRSASHQHFLILIHHQITLWNIFLSPPWPPRTHLHALTRHSVSNTRGGLKGAAWQRLTHLTSPRGVTSRPTAATSSPHHCQRDTGAETD